MEKKLFLTTAMSSVVLFASPAEAQEANNAADASPPAESAQAQNELAQNEYGAGVIVVTARKREETLQSIPASVTAATQETLTRSGATDLADVARLTPGLTLFKGNGGGLSAPTLRGVSNVSVTTFDNNVGVFVNGVYVSAKSNLDIDLFNLSRVEVIKGPQSALYGNNAFAGAINYVLDEPDDVLSGRIKATAGTDGLAEIAGKISVPVSSSLSAQFVGTYSHFGGTVDNSNGPKLGGWDYKVSGSASIDFHPDSDFSANLFYYHYEDEQDGSANFIFTNNCGGTISPVIPANRGGSTKRFYCGELTAPDEVNVDGASFSKRKTDLLIGRAGYDFGAFEMNLTGSWAKFDATVLQDQNLNTLGGTLPTESRRFTRPFAGPVEEYSGELRFESYDNDFLDWAFGGYYYDRTATQDFVVGFGPTQTPRVLDQDNIENAEIKSVFGLTNVKITPEFSIEAQGRWTWEDKDAILINNLTNASLTPQEDFSYGTYRVTANYEWSPDKLLYGVIASGTKSGGFNNTSVLTEQSFGPEKNTTFEIGSKNQFLDGRVSINASAYYIDWSDLQISVPSAVTGQSNPVTNIGSATVKGFEFSLAAQPTPEWDLSFGYAYVDPTWDEGTIDFSSTRQCPSASDCGLQAGPGGIGVDISGFQIPRTSQHQLVAATTYRIPLESSDLYVRADFSYRSEQPTTPIALQELSPEALVNARIGWTNDRYEIALFAKNLFNERYITSSINEPEFFPSTTFTTGFVGNSRTLGISAEAKF